MADTLSIEQVSSQIVELVKSSKNQVITGVRLGVEIRVSFPSFFPQVFRCRNLREFIVRHVPEVKQVGQSGPEIWYGLASDTTPASTRWKVPTSSWRTFTTPHPRYALYANVSTFDVATFPQSVPVGTPWVRVQSCSESEHLRIAMDFLPTIEAGQREALERVLQEPRWWDGFAMETRRLNISQQWISFRHRELFKALMTALDASLTSSGIEVAPVQYSQLVDTVARQDSALRPDARPMSTSADDKLRKIVLAVIGKMTAHELKDLRLPVGDVLQAIHEE